MKTVNTILSSFRKKLTELESALQKRLEAVEDNNAHMNYLRKQNEEHDREIKRAEDAKEHLEKILPKEE